MNSRSLAVLAAICVLGFAGYLIFGRVAPAGKSPATLSSEIAAGEYYTCPMHPRIHKDAPGACPICGMTLVKRSPTQAVSEQDKETGAAISVSPSMQVLANVSTSTAKILSLEKEIRAVGTIDYAEPNSRQISMRFPGRLDKLYLTFTGQGVRNGDPVADVYSPDAISAQQEFLLAKDSYDEIKDATEMISGGALSLLDQSRQKLIRWGFTEHQITELESTKEVRSTITIYSPISGVVVKKNADPQHYAAEGEDIYDVADLSTVWLYTDIYEFEVGTVKIGQRVDAAIDAFPGRSFAGKVVFISPSVDPSSRTVRVRVEIPNPRLELKVGMYANAKILITLHPSVAVPLSAVLSSGSRNIVWIQKSVGVFEPRTVTLGEQAGNFVRILDGIKEGDVVVTSGGYLIDSESQLETAQSSK